jgi:DNA-binding MarR family transcriptional regulator
MLLLRRRRKKKRRIERGVREMTQSRAAKHQDVSDLFKRGNYSLLRLLTIVNAAGPEGITTRKLLDTIGSHDTYTQKVLDKAKDLKLIERVPGESEHGHFPPIYNVITERGKQLLQKQIM